MLKRPNENQVKYPPDMDDRPDEADDYWAVRFGFPAGDKSFADAYDVILKHCTSRTHASIQGLNDVIELTPEHTVLVLDGGSDYQAGVLRAALVNFGAPEDLGQYLGAWAYDVPPSASWTGELYRVRDAVDLGATVWALGVRASCGVRP
jgi:hypothetical protein